MSFKGTDIVIQELHLAKGDLEITAAFVSKSGMVHGVIRHRIPSQVGGSKDLTKVYDATRELVAKLKVWVRATHFDGTQNIPSGETSKHFGIAETLDEEIDLSKDEPA